MDFYPRPPRGGRLTTLVHGIAHGQISIHALREEGDIGQRQGQTPEAISIHALREEGDSPAFNGSNDHIRFLSTPSARRATSLNGLGRSPENNFYPRPPRGGRLAGRANGWDTTLDFYPRPPRGGRPVVMPTHWLMGYFYPRPPRGGRPVRCCRPACSHHHFYPRPPRGGRQTAVSTAVKGLIFLSTPSARRATDEHAHGMTTGKISIHALREEGDTTHEEGTSDETHFYPRPPRGGRHNSFTQNALQADISIHALREEGDR